MQEMDLTPTLAEAAVPTPLEQAPAELDKPSKLDRIKAADAARRGFPGEHWLVLAAGVAVWQYTRKDRHWLVRAIGGVVATTLVARAASGRDGLSKVLRYTPLGRGIGQCPPCEPGQTRR